MDKEIPAATITALARSIIKEASAYGFRQIDTVRLVNELLDACANDAGPSGLVEKESVQTAHPEISSTLPLMGEQIQIRDFDRAVDVELLKTWLPEKYGRFFVLSCATARSDSIDALISDESNRFGIITLHDSTPIGALAYLDHNTAQCRAELRKLIGVPEFRGKGLAEEATRLWIAYGFEGLGLEKVYVSTLQTHLSNIRLNEKIGFKVEGLLRNEVLIDGERRDVLRMGICRD